MSENYCIVIKDTNLVVIGFVDDKKSNYIAYNRIIHNTHLTLYVLYFIIIRTTSRI